MIICNVCGHLITEPIYESIGNISFTSLCKIYNDKTVVFFCHNCTHLQTLEIKHLPDYYDNQYNILIESEEEDDLYINAQGEKTFRVEHQAKKFLEKVIIPSGAMVLDYGCAKASTLKKVASIRNDISIHLFDVSEAYISYWEKITSESKMATYKLKSEWVEYFDVVTSFFSLEHISSLRETIKLIYKILKKDGIFYCLVPNVYDNIADFIVIDHINHFSEYSLKFLLEIEGFDVLSIDSISHRSAFIVVAKKNMKKKPLYTDIYYINNKRDDVSNVASYWKGIAININNFEVKNNYRKSCIYGAGFYGTFIASALKRLSDIVCFVDRNPFLHGKKRLGISIIAPDKLNNDIETVYVGLNPLYARDIINIITEWKDCSYNYFFL